MRLPDEARGELAGGPLPWAVGSVWVIPKRYVEFRGKKDRPCVICDILPDAAGPGQALLVPGTSQGGHPPRLRVSRGEAPFLHEDTTFLLDFPFPLELITLIRKAKHVGLLPPQRIRQLEDSRSLLGRGYAIPREAQRS